MQPSQENPHQPKGLFAPFVINTFQVKSDKGICYNTTSFNEKHNMIITCPSHNSIQFYDATTFSHFAEMETDPLDSSVRDMTFCAEIETFLFRTLNGDIYSYDLRDKTLKTIQKNVDPFLPKVLFISPETYAFPVDASCLCIGNLENEERLTFHTRNQFTCSIENLAKRRLLLVGLDRGSVVLYRTDRLPRLPVLDLIRGHEGNTALEIKSVIINGKEYILAAGYDCKIRVWHMVKGKMRLLRVIQMKETVSCMVYLEDYGMLAIVSCTNLISFMKFLSGKVEKTIDLEMKYCSEIFLMKSKNAIGVTSLEENTIKIIQLHPL